MRIDLLLADRRYYTYEGYAAKHVCCQLKGMHLEHQCIYLSDGNLVDYLAYAQNSPPNWTLSFVNLLPQRTPLCDVLRIPHFFWLEGSFSQAMHFLDSTYGKVGMGDASLCQKITAPNIYFLLHGVDRAASEEKKFDVVCFADLLAFSFLENTWKELFSAEEIVTIKQAISRSDLLGSSSHFFYVEQYLIAQKTYQMATAFKEVKVDIFGEHAGTHWLVQLPKNMRLHTPLPFSEHFEVLKASKMVLAEPNSPWYLPAIASGCLPVSADEKEVTHFLKYPEARESSLKRLQDKLKGQSWEHQVCRLLEIMKPLGG